MNINNLNLKQKVAQMLMFAFHGTAYNDQLKVLINDLNLGGVIFFARNIKDINQVTVLNNEIHKNTKTPMFIGLDQEGGAVLRIIKGITPLPGAMALACSDQTKIFDITKAVGSDLKALGFNLNFAPVGDVNNNPKNPVINSRSYSDDANIVASCSEAAFLGFQTSKILPTMKHFPGHGNTSVDSHLGLPIVDGSIEEIMRCELIPFINAINKGIAGIMMSHILYKDLDDEHPASLSNKIITELLIKKLGFKGLIVTDSLTMGAIYNRYSIEDILTLGINAGNDILMFCGKAELNEQVLIYNTLLNLVETGKISLARIDESVKKILKLKEIYLVGQINKESINLPINNELANYLQEKSITLIRDSGLIPISQKERVLLLFPKINLFSLVDNENQKYETLNKYLSVDEFIYEPEKDNYQEIKNIINNYDKIIMATYNVTDNDYQVKLFNSLDKEKLIIISLRSPYDLHKLNDCKTYICCFEVTRESLKAVSRVLKGEIKAQGRLSINL